MYWKYASLVMFIVFCVWVRVELSLMRNRESDKEEKFWEREREANSTRRKPIDHLDYITVPDTLPFECLNDNAQIAECISVIRDISNEQILNLTGFSNTDIKLEYGVANFDILSKADANYTTLVTTLQKWADELNRNQKQNEAVKLMEYAISIGTDVGSTYRKLGAYYLKTGNIPNFEALMNSAEGIRSLSKNSIIAVLNEMYEKAGLSE